MKKNTSISYNNYNNYNALLYLPVFLLLAGMAAGCSKDGGSKPEEKREIILQSVVTTDMPGGITPSTMSGLSAGDTLLFAKGSGPGTYGDTWKARMASSGRTELLETHYYPLDNSPVYLRGYYPAALLSADNRLHYNLDGSQDLLLSGEQSGRLTDMFWQETKCFRFDHLLTQLRFEVRTDSTATAKGLWLGSLRVEGSRPQAVLSLEKGVLTFGGEAGILTVHRGSGEEALRLDTVPVAVPGRITVEPGALLYLTLRTRDTEEREVSYERLPVTFHTADGLSEAGVSYLLRIRLDSETGPQLWAEVMPWQEGSDGSGVIESRVKD